MLRRILKSVLLALALRDLMVPCNLPIKSAPGPTPSGADSNSRVLKCDQTFSTPPSKKRYCFLTPRLQLSTLRRTPPPPPPHPQNAMLRCLDIFCKARVSENAPTNFVYEGVWGRSQVSKNNTFFWTAVSDTHKSGYVPHAHMCVFRPAHKCLYVCASVSQICG